MIPKSIITICALVEECFGIKFSAYMMKLMTRKSFALVETRNVINLHRRLQDMVFLPLIAGDAGSTELWIKTTSVRDETRKTCGKDHLCINMIYFPRSRHLLLSCL